MPLILYVDKLEATASKTEKLSTIKYNCGVVNSKIMGAFSEALLNEPHARAIKAVGKFFCIIDINIDQNKYTMMFIDFKNNEDAFYRFLQTQKEPITRESSILTFHTIKANQSNHDEFELTEGEPS